MIPREILFVDIGNSRIKWARASEGRLVDPCEDLHMESPATAIQSMVEVQPNDIGRLVAVNVAGPVLGSLLTEVAMNNWGIAPEFVEPVRDGHGIRCGYSDPSQLGADRWVALIAAYQLTKGAASVIDAGTTVTLDSVDAEGQHLGGLIMAGPQMVCAALHQGTDGIGKISRALRPPTGISMLGTDTDKAVANGAMLSVASALDRAIAVLAVGDKERSTVYITGGNALILSDWLETKTQYRANLVLEGLAFVAVEG